MKKLIGLEDLSLDQLITLKDDVVLAYGHESNIDGLAESFQLPSMTVFHLTQPEDLIIAAESEDNTVMCMVPFSTDSETIKKLFKIVCRRWDNLIFSVYV